MLNETIQKSIKKDHDVIRKLVKELETAIKDESKERKAIFNHLATELLAHSKAEEKILYDTLLEDGDDDLNKRVEEGKEEHHVIEVLLKEMKLLNTNDVHWEAKFEVLRENLQHHLKEEEKDILPDSKKVIDDKEESIELSEEFQEEKSQQKIIQS